jgi:hypothetical protein
MLLARSENAMDSVRLGALEALAKRLYWKLEHIDPTDGLTWSEITEYERDNFRICIDELVTMRDELLILLC